MKGFSALIISTMLFSMLLASTTPVAAHTDPPPAGNWVIEDNTTIENETIVVHGDVIIQDGGVLTLKNCILKIDSKFPGWNGIVVEEDGELRIYDTTVTTYGSNQFYTFEVHGKLRIDGGELSRMCLNGLNIHECDSAIVKNTSIRHNGLWCTGITIFDSNATIIGNNIYGNYYGISCLGSSNVIIAENNIQSNQRAGIKCLGNSTVFVEGNTVFKNEYRGFEILGDAIVSITNNIISSNGELGIVCAENSMVRINYNVISNHAKKCVGVQDNSKVDIIGNTIVNSDNLGVVCSDYTIVNITDNFITNIEREGIGTKGFAIVRIISNTIRSTGQGITIYDSSIVDVINNSILDNKWGGLYSNLNPNGELTTENNYLYNNGEAGIKVNYPSTVKLCNNTVSTHPENGIMAVNGATPFIANCTVLDSGEYDLWVDNKSHPAIFNTNFDLNKLFFNDTESIISIGHWVDVNVRNKNNVPVQNTKITVTNNNGIEVFNGTSDYDGHVSCIPVVEYDLDYTFNKTIYTPHNVYASKLGKSASEKITIDRNRVIDFVLDVSDKLARGNLITRVVEGHEVSVEYSGNGTVTIEPVKLVPEIPETIKDIGIFFNLKTNGEVEDLYITVRYSDEELEGVNEADLRMYCYFDPGEFDPGEYDPGEYDPGEFKGGWVMIKNSGVDVHSNVVWAKVSHATIFAPMARETSKQTGPGTTTIWLWYSSIIAVLAIILIIFISVIMKKKIGIGSNKKTKRRINL